MDFFGWEDLDGDGHVDEVESLLADDLMCTNDEERELNADIDPDDFRLMDEEERLEALDDAGLDPDDFDDFL